MERNITARSAIIASATSHIRCCRKASQTREHQTVTASSLKLSPGSAVRVRTIQSIERHSHLLAEGGHSVSALSWPSVGFYCLFGIFVFYQQLHGKNFQGSSRAFGLALNVSALFGTITALAYLVFYGWSVVWWAPFVIVILGIAAAFLGFVVERLVGALALSLCAFLGWPICAYFMFRYVPSGI